MLEVDEIETEAAVLIGVEHEVLVVEIRIDEGQFPLENDSFRDPRRRRVVCNCLCEDVNVEARPLQGTSMPLGCTRTYLLC